MTKAKKKEIFTCEGYCPECGSEKREIMGLSAPTKVGTVSYIQFRCEECKYLYAERLKAVYLYTEKINEEDIIPLVGPF